MPGQIGRALFFSGAESAQYVRVPNYPKPANALTVSGWVYAESRPVWASIAKNWGSSKTGQFHFGLNASDGDLSSYLTTAQGPLVSVREGTPFPTAAWQHVAFTADGSRLRLFRNGVEVAAATYSGPLPPPPLDPLAFGVKLNDSGTGPDGGAPGFWHGKMDDLALWARALDPSEVAAIYSAGLEGIAVTNARVQPPVPGPDIRLAGHYPMVPSTNDSLTVTCAVEVVSAPITNVTLHWRRMFEPLRSTPMSLTNGCYSATLTNSPSGPEPWQAGQLLRWYIIATDSLGHSSRWPPFTNTLNSAQYVGTVLAPAAVSTSSLPVLHWFVETPAAADSDAGTRCSLFFNDTYYDNLGVRIRGGTSRSWPKKSYKFEFNSGERFFVRANLPRVSEFDLNSTYTDKSYVRAVLNADFDHAAGLPAPEHFHFHVRQNNAFFSVALYVEHPDERFLRRYGFDPEGAFYKALGDPLGTYEKKTRLAENDSDLQGLLAGLKSTGPTLETFVFDNVSLANVINYMATVAVTQNIDASDKNHYLYRDTNGSKEWRIFPWDLDLTFGPDYLNTDTIVFNLCDLASPHCPSHPFIGARPYLLHAEKYHPLLEAIVKIPRTRAMLLRRIRTLTDQYLGTGYLQDRAENLYPALAPDVILDHAKWGGDSHFAGRTYTLRQAIDRIKTEYLSPRLSYLRGASIPGIGTANPQPQAENINVFLAEVEANPVGGTQDQEFIRIENTNSVAVDLSGWTLSGAVDQTFEAGTVIPAYDSLYACADTLAFRARTAAPSGGQTLLVQGNFDGHLNVRGELLVLSDATGRLVSSTNLPAAPSLAQRYLRITELMYHPAAIPGNTNDPGQFEFVELRNVSTAIPLELAGVRFTEGIGFNFTTSSITRLEPEAFALIARNVSAFTSCYGTLLPLAGQYTGALDNSGERVRLEDAAGEKILEFRFDPAWYPIAGGQGASLVPLKEAQPWSAWDSTSGWRPTSYLYGSPAFSEDNIPAIVNLEYQSSGVRLTARVPMSFHAQLESCSDLSASPWAPVSDPVVGAGDLFQILDTAPSLTRFYRLRTSRD